MAYEGELSPVGRACEVFEIESGILRSVISRVFSATDVTYTIGFARREPYEVTIPLHVLLDEEQRQDAIGRLIQDVNY